MEGARPTLGVGVPALDEAAALPALLARLRGAVDDDRPERVVVSDGGSTDGTPALARAAGARVVEGARGRGAQLAAAARALDTDVLCFLHADCLPAPGALAAVRAAFADPALEVAAFRQQVEAPGRFYRLVERATSFRAGALGLVYGDAGLCVRRGLYEAVGGFRDLPLFEDLDLSRRLRRRARARVRVIEDAPLFVSARRWQGEGALRCTLRNWILTAAWLCGAPPARLARYYPRRAGRGAAAERAGEGTA